MWQLLPKRYLKNFKRRNIDLRQGTFRNVIPGILKEQKAFDIVFFDGHHSKEATLEYFEQFVNNVKEDALYIFDDIHWSPGMEDAWHVIKKHEKVNFNDRPVRNGPCFLHAEKPERAFCHSILINSALK